MDRSTSSTFQTETEFTLPKGFIDETGVLHRKGVMRLATAADEILPLRDPRVQSNPAYLTIIILARVVTRLGSIPQVDTQLIEGLFACDLEFLRALYEDINSVEDPEGLPLANGADRHMMRAAGGLPALGEA